MHVNCTLADSESSKLLMQQKKKKKKKTGRASRWRRDAGRGHKIYVAKRLIETPSDFLPIFSVNSPNLPYTEAMLQNNLGFIYHLEYVIPSCLGCINIRFVFMEVTNNF